MESISVLWPLVTGGLIVPIVARLKPLIPADLPFLWFAAQGVLNIAALAGLHLILSVPIDWPSLLKLATAGMVVTNGAHSMWKTKKKANGET